MRLAILSGNLGTRFLRSRFMPLATVLLLFLLWGVCLTVILYSAKVGEKISVYGRFSECGPCGNVKQVKGISLCFNGIISEGNLSASRSEEFVFTVEDDGSAGMETSVNVIVGAWLAGVSDISFCLETTETDKIQQLVSASDNGFTFTLRRESLMSVLWRKENRNNED